MMKTNNRNKYNTTITLLGIVTATILLIPILAQAPALVATAQQDQKAPITLNEKFANVESELPGFSGAFLDDAGKLNVYVMDPAHADGTAVATAIAKHLGSEHLEKGLVILQGKYEWGKLLAWKNMARSLFDQKELRVNTLDADEKGQALVIGIKVLNEENESKVIQALAKYPIPIDAMQFIEAPGEILESHTLISETVRPIKGGHGIAYDFQEGCTSSFIAQRSSDYVKVGVTNGHCETTRTMAGEEDYYQPKVVNGGTKIGDEIANTNLPGPRWSDSLLYLPSVSSSIAVIYRGSGLADYVIQSKEYTQLVGQHLQDGSRNS